MGAIVMVTLKNEFITAKFNEKGAELKSLIYDGTQYIWEGDPKIWNDSCPILFPICGALKGGKYTFGGKEYTLQKHGFAISTIFEIESASDEKVVFFNKSDDVTKEHFPFDYEFRVIYTLNGKSLEVEYRITNKSDCTMYFSIGSHEGYYTPEGIEDYDIIFPEKETLDCYLTEGDLLSENTIPVIKDSCYLPLYDKVFKEHTLIFKDLKSHKATLRNRKTGRAVTVEFPDDKYFLIWHMYEAPYICLEPWGGIPDNCNTDGDITKKEGIIALPPHTEHKHRHTVTIH